MKATLTMQGIMYARSRWLGLALVFKCFAHDRCHTFTGAELGSFPPANLLEGIGQFNLSEQNDSKKMVAQLMSKLKAKIEVPRASSSMVPTGEGLPSLPKKCVDKILAGDFMDFAELPPVKGKGGPNRSHPSSRSDGEYQTLPRGSNALAFTQQRSLLRNQNEQELAGFFVTDSQVQPEVQVAIMGGVRSQLPSRHSRNWSEGLVKGGAQHLYAMFHGHSK